MNLKLEKKQISELYDNDNFVFSDGSMVKFFSSKFNTKSKKIYLFIHDIYGLNDDTINFIKNSEKNIISFVQTGFNTDPYNKSFSLTYVHILDILSYFNKLYTDHKIIIVCEGFSYLLVYKLINKYKMIFINPILDKRYIELPLFIKFKILLPFICRLNSKIDINVDFNNINNINKNLVLQFNYLYLYKIMNSMIKFKMTKNSNISVIQTKESFFYSKKKSAKKLKNIKPIYIESNIHNLSNTNHFNELFL